MKRSFVLLTLGLVLLLAGCGQPVRTERQQGNLYRTVVHYTGENEAAAYEEIAPYVKECGAEESVREVERVTQ